MRPTKDKFNREKNLLPSGLSRRQFLASAGGISLVFVAGALIPKSFRSEKEVLDAAPKSITAWVHVSQDNKICRAFLYARVASYGPAAPRSPGYNTDPFCTQITNNSRGVIGGAIVDDDDSHGQAGRFLP